MNVKRPAVRRTWDLEKLVAIKDFEARRLALADDLTKLATISSALSPQHSVESFKQFLLTLEDWRSRFAILASRLSLAEALDWKDADAARFNPEIHALGLRVAEFVRPLEQWLAGREVLGRERLDDANARRLFAAVPELEHHLWHERRAAEHLLSQAEEKIITHKDLNLETPLLELHQIRETEEEYQLCLPKRPLRRIKSQAKLMALTSDRRPPWRRAAYQALLATKRQFSHQSFLVYQAVVRDWADNAAWRHYPSAIAVRNFDNDLPDQVPAALLDAVWSERGVFQDFFRLKARRLGHKRLSRFDLYAPLEPARFAPEYSLPQAERLVLSAFDNFSPVFGAAARRIIESGHLDSHPSPRKQSGAFCAAIAPTVAPYVLLNYSDRARDVATLAHELGHGLHFDLASRLPASVQVASLPLAETASTLAEIILFEAMLAETTSPRARAVLLERRLADAYATILRQTGIVRFELEAHTLIKAGASEPDLSRRWLELNREHLSPAVTVPDLFRYEWSYIPHIFHTPFYCYAYSFGQLLALALYERYRASGPAFAAKIETVLAAGASIEPLTLLQSVDCPIESPDFWRSGYAPIRRWQKELNLIYDKG